MVSEKRLLRTIKVDRLANNMGFRKTEDFQTHCDTPLIAKDRNEDCNLEFGIGTFFGEPARVIDVRDGCRQCRHLGTN